MDSLSGPKSTSNCLVESSNYYWDTGSEVLDGDIINNNTEKYNNMVATKECTKTDTNDSKILALTPFFSKL